MESPLQAYLSKFDSLHQLPKGPTLSEDDAIRWLIDEAFKASKLMIRTHLKDDIVRFIILAQVLESHGYRMQWVKFKGVIGATKVGVVIASAPSITGVTKEVQARVDKRSGQVVDEVNRIV
jgi:hypothetical protein